MRRFSEKLLVYFTALLMALSPLQVTATSFSDTLVMPDCLIQNSAVLVEDTVIPADYSPAQACDHCKVEQRCFSYSCSSGQCTTCAMLLSPTTLTSRVPFARLELSQADMGIARLLPDPLFRPPKK